jgi:hypothetical protein
MTVTELRDTFASVSDAVSVPVPDAAAFERRVAGVRRRRTAARVCATAAVAVVAGGSAFALSLGGGPSDHAPPAHDTAVEAPHWVPVVVAGHLHTVDESGAMGGEGPAVDSIVGTTPQGVVVLTEDGTLGRIEDGSEQLRQLVPDRVRTAYLDGDAVVYENWNGLIQWWGIEPTVMSSNTAQTDQGRLMAATTDRVVIAGGPEGALVSWDADGPHELVLKNVTELNGVETGGDVIAVHTEDGVIFFSPDGLHSTRYVGDRVGALAPDGHSYAQQTKSRMGVELLDPTTLRISRVEGPSGAINGVGWAPDGDLLAVVQADGARTLWRCTPDGAGCEAQLDDPTGTLRLGHLPP